VAGLAVVAGDDLQGVQVAGAAVVGEASVRGLQATLGAAEAGVRFEGLTVAGYRVRAPEARGLSVAGAYTDVDRLAGVSVSGVHLLRVSMGLTLGIVNWADELHGIQIGLLNRAANNRSPFRILPFLNAHF
jgi:hypothetical protein